MNRLIIVITALLLSLNTNAQHANDSVSEESENKPKSVSNNQFSLFKNKYLTLDFKFLDPTKGSFGIDYDFNLERNLLKSPKPGAINALNLSLASKGFITVAGSDNKNNSIISEVKLEGFPIFHIQNTEDPQAATNETWADYIGDPESSIEKDPLVNWARSRSEQVASPLWLFLDVHGRHESTQDFHDYDLAVGSSISLTSSFLSKILDYPFGLLRGEAFNNPRQLSLSIGYDYVSSVNKTKLEYLTDSVNFLNRLNFKAEWETGILTKRDRISFLFDSYYHIDNHSALEAAEKKWNYFYVIKLDHLLYYNTSTHTLIKASVKYTHGGLPPNFDVGYVLGGGFSLDF